MLNRIILMGRITRDLELRQTNSGVSVLSFSIACERDYKSGESEKKTDFIDCVAWRGTAEFISRYFSKGRQIIVDGSLQIDEWTDKEGNKRRNAKVNIQNAYFCGDKSDSSKKQQPTQQGFGGFEELAGYDFDLPE